MAKIVFTSITSGFTTTAEINANNASIAAEFQDKVLYRDNTSGEDNTMQNSLDMNSNQILNLPIATADTEAVRFSQISTLVAGGAIPIQDEGVETVAVPTDINYAGDGVVVTDVSSVATVTIDAPYDLASHAPGITVDDEVLGQHTFTRDVEFPDDFAGAAGDIGINPTSTTAIDIHKNDVSIGDISISTGGVFTFTSDASGVVSFAAGDKIEFINQSTADATAADLSWTLAGTRK